MAREPRDSEGWRRPGFRPGIVVFMLMVVMTAYGWLRLPSDVRIAIQWDFQGNPTNLVDKGYALLLLPGVMLVLAPLLDVIPFLPYGKKSALYSGQYNLLVWYALLVIFPVLHFITIVVALRNVAVPAGGGP